MPGLRARGGLLRRLGSRDEGAIAVVVAIMMVVIMGMAALVIDIGGIEGRKSSLQNAADAAALAIAQGCMDSMASSGGTCDPAVQSAAPTAALSLAKGNVADGNVQIGSIGFPANQVTVTVSAMQGDVFAQIFGTTQTPVTATATAQWVKAATVLPLLFPACMLPSPGTQTTLRTDLLNLAPALNGQCGLINGVLGDLEPPWQSSDCKTVNQNLIQTILGTLNQVLPLTCTKPYLDSLVGHDVLLPVYANGALGQILGCGVLGGLLLPACQVQSYALFRFTGYDFQAVNATVVLGDLGLNVATGQVVNNPPAVCVSQNATLLNNVTINLGQPLCQGIQGTFQQLVTPAQASVLTSATSGVRLVA
jgi:Flp pilus assembly protein TadG